MTTGDNRFLDFAASLTDLLLQKVDISRSNAFQENSDVFFGHWFGTEIVQQMQGYRTISLAATLWHKPIGRAPVYTLQTALLLYCLPDQKEKATRAMYSDLGSTLSLLLPSEQLSNGSIDAIINKDLALSHSSKLSAALGEVGIDRIAVEPYPEDYIGSFTIRAQKDSLHGDPLLITGYCNEELDTYQLDINLPVLLSLRENGDTRRKVYFSSVYGELADQLAEQTVGFATASGTEEVSLLEVFDCAIVGSRSASDALATDELAVLSSASELSFEDISRYYAAAMQSANHLDLELRRIRSRYAASSSELQLWERMLYAGPLKSSRATRADETLQVPTHQDTLMKMIGVTFEHSDDIRFYGCLQESGYAHSFGRHFYELHMWFTEMDTSFGGVERILDRVAPELATFFTDVYAGSTLSKDAIVLEVESGYLGDIVQAPFQQHFTVESRTDVPKKVRFCYRHGDELYELGWMQVAVPETDRHAHFQDLDSYDELHRAHLDQYGDDEDFAAVEELDGDIDDIAANMQGVERVYEHQLSARVIVHLYADLLSQPTSISESFVYAASRLHRLYPHLSGGTIEQLARKANYVAAYHAIRSSSERPVEQSGLYDFAEQAGIPSSHIQVFTNNLRKLFHEPIAYLTRERLASSNPN